MSPLEINATGGLQVREVWLTLGLPLTKLLYISDLHLAPWNRHLVRQLLETAQVLKPDAILLGGDLADWPAALPILTDCIKDLRAIAPVMAVPGNHDFKVGCEKVRAAVCAGGGLWLLDSPFEMYDGLLRIDGTFNPQEATVRIFCGHIPDIFPAAIQQGYDVVLAGHLHGSQMVWWESDQRLYPGAWFFRWNGLQFQNEKTTLIVSRGVNDTLPIRWNCSREVILCHLT